VEGKRKLSSQIAILELPGHGGAPEWVHCLALGLLSRWPKLIFMNWKILTSNDQSAYGIGLVVRSRAPFGALAKG